MRSQFLRGVLFLIAIVLWAHSSLFADAQPDLSSPKKAATAFALALQKGDFAALKGVTTGGADDYKLMQSVTGMTAAANKLHDAIVSRFGAEEGKKIPLTTGEPGDIPRQIEESDEKVEGNSASITKKGAAAGNSVKLKKDGGVWKVDLSQFPQKDQIVLQAPMLDTTGKVLAQAATDVSAGKYKSATEASQDVQQRMMAAMASMMKSAQPPATQGSR
ncbi:MAG TPA: hypothetical protein VIM11_05405 [Tepidisphaeraceae bacterium]